MERSKKLIKILVVDPDSDFLDWAESQLLTPETRVITTTDSEQAFNIFCSETPDLLVTEVRVAPVNGLELLKRVRQRNPNAMVVLTSSYSTTQSVIEAMRLGAFEYIRKESLPFTFKMVVDAALKALEEMRAATEFKPQLTVEQHQDSIVGKSEAMQEVFKMIGRVAHTDAPAMITGESGSGKELVARAIHNFSHRATKPFIAINCAAVPENLLESELFGHEKGAFTGAVTQRIGRFEQSDGGSLFLDEIGDLPLAVQGKLLRVLQEGEFSRVGGTANLKTDVRIIAATNKALESEVAARMFREDLFYRLNVVRLHLPPLRERVEDVRLLAEYFLQKITSRKHLPRLRLSEEAIRVLESYPWPGNVRELENSLQRACVLATGEVLLPKDIPLGAVNRRDGESPPATRTLPALVETGGGQERTEAVGAQTPGVADASDTEISRAVETLFRAAGDNAEFQLLPWLEREFTLMAMRKTRGNQIRAAKMLGVSRATLRKRLERFGIAKNGESDSGD